jgi:hypothetical protein
MAWAGEDGRVIEGHELFNRIRFDDVFHVAISGGRVFFGSSVDGRVICRDLATGKEDKWSFFTNAPVRLAPTMGMERCMSARMMATRIASMRRAASWCGSCAQGRMMSASSLAGA